MTESLILPPSPLLLLYSDRGVLCPFTMINKDAAAAIKLKELIKSAKPLPSDPRLIRQPKQASGGTQGNPLPPATVHPSSAATTSIASAAASFQGQLQQQQPQRVATPLESSSGLEGLSLTSLKKSPFSQPPGGLAGKGLTASPLGSGGVLGGLNQGSPSFGQPPSLGQRSLSLEGQSVSFSQPLSGGGQPSPLLSQLSQNSRGQVLGSRTTATPQQQQQSRQPLSSSGGASLLGGSGIPGSGLAPARFPFSVSSLASSAVATSSPPPLGTANKPSPQLPPSSLSSSPQQQQQQLHQQLQMLQQQQQQQQQKKQSPLSLPQSSLPQSQPSVQQQPPPAATAVQASGTTIGGLRFAPGYLSQVQQSTPPSSITGASPLLGQQLSLSSASPGVGLTKTIGMTSSAAPPPPSSLVSQLPSVSGVSHPSIPPSSQTPRPPLQQQQQLAAKPLHSSTPLAPHPATGGLHPQQPRPLPPHLLTAATTTTPMVPSSAAGVVRPLSGPSLSVRMAAPKPVGGNVQGGGGPSVVGVAPTAAGQPRTPVVSPGSTAYQLPQMVGGMRAPFVQKQPPPAYGYGAPPPPPSSVGGALGPPRTAHHAPPPPSAAVDDTEVTVFRIMLVLLHIVSCEMLSVHAVTRFSSSFGIQICHIHPERSK